eukprot:268542-Karenia_brevis.AAC.1
MLIIVVTMIFPQVTLSNLVDLVTLLRTVVDELFPEVWMDFLNAASEIISSGGNLNKAVMDIVPN